MKIAPKYIGDDLVLLLGLSEEDEEQIMHGGQDRSSPMFYSMEKWSPSLRTGNRLVWVHCWGIPLQAWDKKYIQQIMSVMGEMVDMDDEVEEKRRLDRARVLIKTSWRPTIQHTIHVLTADETFAVDVIKETTSTYHEGIRGRRSVGGSSDDIFSDDSSYGDRHSQTHSQTHCGDAATSSAANAMPEAHMQTSTVPETQVERGCRTDGGLESHGTILLPSGLSNFEYPVDNIVNQRTIAEPQWVTAAPHKFHQNGNFERREKEGLTETHNDSIAATPDHSSIGDPTEPKDQSCSNGKFKNVEEDEDRGVETPREQRMGICEDISGPNHITSSSICTPNGKMHKLGLGPIATKAETENNTWQVYSRQKRYQKKSKPGLNECNTVETEQGSSARNQPLQILARRDSAYCETNNCASDISNHNGGRGPNTESHQVWLNSWELQEEMRMMLSSKKSN